jgi:CO/xanthine dehydrogenase Mo-binding subunit
VHRLPGDAPPGGVGELGYPATPPAVANAVYATTGRRLHRLPMRPADLQGPLPPAGESGRRVYLPRVGNP